MTKPEIDAWIAAATADWCPFCPPGDRRHIARDPELDSDLYQRFATTLDEVDRAIGIDGYLACERCTALWKSTATMQRPPLRILNMETPPCKRIAPRHCLHYGHGLAYWAWETVPYCAACLARFAAMKPEIAAEVAAALELSESED